MGCRHHFMPGGNTDITPLQITRIFLKYADWYFKSVIFYRMDSFSMRKNPVLFACFSLLFSLTYPFFSAYADYEIFDDFHVYDNQIFDLENADQIEADRVLDEIVIKFVDPSDVPGKENQLQHEIDKVRKIGFIEALGVYVVNIEDLEKNPNAVLNRLKNNRFIEYVEPNYILNYSVTPNDLQYKLQSSALTLINAPSGWDITTGKNSPAIAVIDTGVVASHPDLPKFHNGYAAISGLSFNNDKVGHGTAVAGVLGAVGNNSIGIAGINWNANIMPVKVDNANGSTTVANVAKGIIWAADNGARVLNLSLGMSSDSITLQAAIDYAYKMGCAIFAASGNDGKESILYPARYSNVMAVGSTTNGTSRVSYSNYGTGLDVVAIGSYYSTTAAGSYGSVSGTSFATPQVAGLASLILAINPKLTNEEVYALIRQGAKPLGGGFNKQTGYGLINVANTLELAVATSTPSKATSAPDLAKKSYNYVIPPVITLNSFAELELFVGDDYKETGYFAADCFGMDITPYVTVTGFVDTSKAGVYILIYSVIDGGGNTARVYRTITVIDKPIEVKMPVEPPTITVIGSNPIVLYMDSGTPYIEQGALAIDSYGRDISSRVEIFGNPDRFNAGSYTITYIVTDDNGMEALATREVRIIVPAYENPVRTSYGLRGQAKQNKSITYTNIVAGGSGWLNLKVSNIDRNATINVQFVDASTKSVVFVDNFSAKGSKQYKIGKGKYLLVVSIKKANGNCKFSVDLLMPEVIDSTYDQLEVMY